MVSVLNKRCRVPSVNISSAGIALFSWPWLIIVIALVVTFVIEILIMHACYSCISTFHSRQHAQPHQQHTTAHSYSTQQHPATHSSRLLKAEHRITHQHQTAPSNTKRQHQTPAPNASTKRQHQRPAPKTSTKDKYQRPTPKTSTKDQH